MAQQTAVEWLINELLFIQSLNEDEITESNKAILTTSTIEQAKQMEKEQIVDAHYQGYRNDISTTDISEQYYNETYNK